MVSSCKAQERIYVDQEAAEKLSQDVQTPSTVLVWIDGAWSGDSVSYKQLFAGSGRPTDHAIDTPRVSRWNRTAILTIILGREAARYVKGYDQAGDPSR